MGLQDEQESLSKKIRHRILGRPLNVREPSLFHKLSLIPLLAWIGLGADGLSSSAYGPEEAFRTIGSHTYLAVFLAMATAFTVFVISYAYSRIIEHFPHGGGGYIVASHTIGRNVGVVSGCALLVDYMLTITVSVAACGDAVFSFVPIQYHELKLSFAVFLIILLVVLNIRGVKESISILAPIFFTFVLTHALLIGYGLTTHTPKVLPLLNDVQGSLGKDLASVGLIGILAIFLRAFSLGGGTYTGIEAVSNGMQIMREPKVESGKRMMLYMATSLAVTAGGLLFCYYLFKINPAEGKTLNSVLADNVFGTWPLGKTIALITIFSEGALLLVAAQTGFVDGPRVMSNMAIDSWLPRRFASLSERFTMQNGVVVMSTAALALLFYTRGSVGSHRHVFDQRLPHVFSFPTRDDDLLCEESGKGKTMVETYPGARRRLYRLCHHSGGDRIREVPGGWVGDPAHHNRCGCLVLCDPPPLRQDPVGHACTRSDAIGYSERSTHQRGSGQPPAILRQFFW